MKYYIGIDPDLRLLNTAIVDENKKPLAVFAVRNKEGADDVAVANAAVLAWQLLNDVRAFLIAEAPGVEVVAVIESQNIQYTGHTNTASKQRVLQVAQVAGIMAAAFSTLCNDVILVQPNAWKGNVPKEIHHRRIYSWLGIPVGADKSAGNTYPSEESRNILTRWTAEKINPGDFTDINDSLGLALYGATKGL